MNLEPAPRLPKWIFLAIDAGLLLTAFLIVYFAKDAYAPLPFVSAVLCVALAAVIGLVPFLVDFAAESADAIDAERERLKEQAARVQGTIDSLARAAAQIKAVEEAVHKAAREAETLPYRMQEKLAEFNEALSAKEESDREALESELEELRTAQGDALKTAAEKIAKSTAELAALEATLRKQVGAAEALITKLQSAANDAGARFDEKIAGSVQQLDSKLTEIKQAAEALKVAPVPVAAAVVATRAETAPTPVEPAPKAAEPVSAPEASLPTSISTETVAAEPTAEHAPAADAAVSAEIAAPESASVEAPKPKKPRAPRKPKPEEISTEPALIESISVESTPAPAPAIEEKSEAPTLELAPEPAVEKSPEPAESLDTSDASESSAPANALESSTSSDGATRLLATAYIGIGNKLFIRGDGPGLSWDQGVPMQFVSIGKWGWFTHDASGPVRCKLYKNDETVALTGEIVLEAGRHTEVTALF